LKGEVFIETNIKLNLTPKFVLFGVRGDMGMGLEKLLHFEI
jgi:hypothetical protein